MAIIWMDGPDHYGTDPNLLTDGVYAQAGTGLLANAGPGGVGTVFTFGLNALLRKVLPGERTALGVGQRLYFPNLPAANNRARVMQWRSIENVSLFTATVISTGAIEIREVDGNLLETLIYRTEPVITAESWRHLEIFVDLESGTLRIGVDSVTVVDVDGLVLPGDAIAQVAMWHNFFDNITGWRMRDLYIWDTNGALNNSGMQGDRQVLTCFPDSDGPQQEWAPSAGAQGWPIVSNNPPDDDVYIAANEQGDISDFGMDDIDTDITSISALMAVGRMKKSDAGLATMRFTIESDGTVGDGTEKALSTEFAYYSQIFETDPDTDLKWTPLGVNNALIGVERVE